MVVEFFSIACFFCNFERRWQSSVVFFNWPAQFHCGQCCRELLRGLPLANPIWKKKTMYSEKLLAYLFYMLSTLSPLTGFSLLSLVLQAVDEVSPSSSFRICAIRICKSVGKQFAYMRSERRCDISHNQRIKSRLFIDNKYFCLASLVIFWKIRIAYMFFLKSTVV